MTTQHNRERQKAKRDFPGWIRVPCLLIALVLFIVLEGVRVVFFGPRDEDDGSQP